MPVQYAYQNGQVQQITTDTPGLPPGMIAATPAQITAWQHPPQPPTVCHGTIGVSPSGELVNYADAPALMRDVLAGRAVPASNLQVQEYFTQKTPAQPIVPFTESKAAIVSRGENPSQYQFYTVQGREVAIPNFVANALHGTNLPDTSYAATHGPAMTGAQATEYWRSALASVGIGTLSDNSGSAATIVKSTIGNVDPSVIALGNAETAAGYGARVSRIAITSVTAQRPSDSLPWWGNDARNVAIGAKGLSSIPYVVAGTNPAVSLMGGTTNELPSASKDSKIGITSVTTRDPSGLFTGMYVNEGNGSYKSVFSPQQLYNINLGKSMSQEMFDSLLPDPFKSTPSPASGTKPSFASYVSAFPVIGAASLGLATWGMETNKFVRDWFTTTQNASDTAQTAITNQNWFLKQTLPEIIIQNHLMTGFIESPLELGLSLSVLPAAAIAIVTEPGAMAKSVVPGLTQQGQGLYKQATEDPTRFIGNLLGTYATVKVVSPYLPKLPAVRAGGFELPIETPEGLPKTEIITMGMKPTLKQVTVDGVIKYQLPEDAARVLEPLTKESNIQYTAQYKGLYLDANYKLPLGFKTGDYYAGKIPLVGAGFEAGGEFLSGMRDTPIIGAAVNFARSLPVTSSIIRYLESRPVVLTGLWVGEESPGLFGSSIESRISGAIDFLSDQKPETAIQKLNAVKQFMSPEDVATVKAIIELRDITSTHQDLITVKEPFGAIPPVTMQPETFSALMEYMNANAEDMRAYGSLVGRAYLGEGGRSTLGDIDALIKSDVAQAHSERMWEIYLNKEFGENVYTVSTTEKLYETGGIKYSDVLKVATNKQTGELLSRLQSGASQITGRRMMGLTPTGEHALDLHPVSNLKYTQDLLGTDVKTIPVSELIWGKQTIGNPPIGTVTIDRAGSDVVISTGGRVKDAFDTMAFARTAAADAYRNPDISFEIGQRLEGAAKTLADGVWGVQQSERIGGYPEGVTLGTFLKEHTNPLESDDVVLAKFNKLTDSVSNKQYFMSGVPVNEEYESFQRNGDYWGESTPHYLIGGMLGYIGKNYYGYDAERYTTPNGSYFEQVLSKYQEPPAAPSKYKGSVAQPNYDVYGSYFGNYKNYLPSVYTTSGYGTEKYNPLQYTPAPYNSQYTPELYNPQQYQPAAYTPDIPTYAPKGGTVNVDTFLTTIIPTTNRKPIETPTKEEYPYYRKRRIPRNYLFEEIAPALTPKDMIGVKPQKAFYRVLGHGNLVEKRTPPSEEVYRRADADFTNRATDSAQDMIGLTFFRTATKKEGAPRIMQRQPSAQDFVEVVGGSKKTRGKSRGDTWIRGLM